MWNDCETNEDFIDYQHFVTGVSKIINNDNLLPCSIGVFGDWGSGKSSLMKMVEETFGDNKDVLVIKFNGWLFEGYEDTKTVLMGRIVDEVIKKRKLSEKATKLAAKLLKKIDLLKTSGSLIKYGAGFLTMGPAGLAAMSFSDVAAKFKEEDYEKYIKDVKADDGGNSLRDNIQDFHKNFEELIKETEIKKLVVIIDDLDRCSADTIIATLEAIKLFLFTKQTAFILGADERLIRYAVKRRFPEIPGDNMEVGRDYLEKLIQYPVRIPALNQNELTTYINLLFTQLYVDIGEFFTIRENVIKEKNKKGFDFVFNTSNVADFVVKTTPELQEAFLLSAQIIPVLSVGLSGNPRQCKRFLNTLLLRHEMAKSKGIILSKRLLAKLMLLEYFKPETFKRFYDLQSHTGGILKDIERMEKQATNREEGVVLTPEEEGYLADPWIKNWLQSEPSLKGQNMQPYFYFSRDRVTGTSVHLQRMTPMAQEVYRKLIAEAETIRGVGLKDCRNLSQGDASAILESLIEKFVQDDKQNSDGTTIKTIFEYCKTRTELQSQVLSFLERLPEQAVPLTTPVLLLDMVKGGGFENQTKEIIAKWSNSTTNPTLAKITKQKIIK